jgi:Tfp pilus assembly protein PilN
MSYLNLIPESQKKRLKKERLFFLVHSIVGLLVVVMAISAISLTTARFILIDHFTQLRDDTSLLDPKLLRLQTNIGAINTQIKDAAIIQESFIKWSDLLSELTRAVPRGITINFMNVNVESNSFRLTGIATGRAALLELKEALEASESIAVLESPLSNFLEKEDIEFRFSGTLKEKIDQMPIKPLTPNL